VAAGREESGNAFLSGRELAIEDALASKAHIDALAVALRKGGLPGTLQRLRVLAFNDLTRGRDPRDRLTGPRPAGDEAGQDSHQDGPPSPGGDDHDDGTAGAPAGPAAPFPALINLTVPAGTILGWSAAPGEAAGWGLTGPGDTRRLAQAASMHPRTRWCATLLAPDSTAVAHGCARGSHPGSRRRKAAGDTATDPTRGRPPRSPACCAASPSPSPRSPRAPATTPAPRTATPPAAH
jgi:hypothetical protein